MMQNINRNTSFDDYGAEPSASVWEKIEMRLPPPSGRKRGWLIWSAAAVLLTGVFVTSYFFDVEIKPKHNEPKQDTAPAAKSEIKTDVKPTASEENRSTGMETAEVNNSEAREYLPVNISSKKEEKYNRKEKSSSVIAESRSKAAETVNTESEKSILTGKEKTVSANAVAREKPYEENIPTKIFALVPVPEYFPDVFSAPVVDFGDGRKKNSVSRWQLSLLAGWDYSYRVLDFNLSGSNAITEGERNYLSENEAGINTVSFKTEISYNISTRFSLVSGISYFTEGQERNPSELVLTSGDPGSPVTVYTINTSAGNLSGNGQQFDNAFYNNSDSSVFPLPPPLLGSPGPYDTAATKYFVLKQEFSFINIPLMIQYRFAEHRFTPYFGLGFSAGYMFREKISVNDNAIDYEYPAGFKKIIFFAEAQAGVKYRLKNSLSLKLQPSLRYGLNSLSNSNNVTWVPYSAGLGAGINYRF